MPKLKGVALSTKATWPQLLKKMFGMLAKNGFKIIFEGLFEWRRGLATSFQANSPWFDALKRIHFADAGDTAMIPCNPPVPAKYIPSLRNRGNWVLIDELGFNYNSGKLIKTNGNVAWRCSRHNQGCKSRVQTQGDLIIMKRRWPHNHEPMFIDKYLQM